MVDTTIRVLFVYSRDIGIDNCRVKYLAMRDIRFNNNDTDDLGKLVRLTDLFGCLRKTYSPDLEIIALGYKGVLSEDNHNVKEAFLKYVNNCYGPKDNKTGVASILAIETNTGIQNDISLTLNDDLESLIRNHKYLIYRLIVECKWIDTIDEYYSQLLIGGDTPIPEIVLK